MPRLLLFAAWTSDDAALWNSRWIARETARLAPAAASLLEGEGAVREALEAALDDAQMEGVALFGHGLPHAFIGADGRHASPRRSVSAWRG